MNSVNTAMVIEQLLRIKEKLPLFKWEGNWIFNEGI